MNLRHILRLCLLSVSLLIGVATPAVWADVAPSPRPNPPQPPPPQPNPPPGPAPDDGESQVRPVVIATAASLGVALLGVWVIRKQLRRSVSNASAATT